MTVRVIAAPKIFVGYRYNDEDEIIAENFIELLKLEGFNVITGKGAESMNVDAKVRQRIDESEGTIIIFTRDHSCNLQQVMFQLEEILHLLQLLRR